MRIGFGYDSHRFEGAIPEADDRGSGLQTACQKLTTTVNLNLQPQPQSQPESQPKPLILGGIEFPGETGLKGHSDADVLCHAIIDALLGAAALGDIGSHFPDTDAEWKGADSTKLLAAVVKEIRAAGYAIGNIDATIICERPKIRPVVELIRDRLAAVMNVGRGRLSVKGKGRMMEPEAIFSQCL